jgi:hypothetical protein
MNSRMLTQKKQLTRYLLALESFRSIPLLLKLRPAKGVDTDMGQGKVL